MVRQNQELALHHRIRAKVLASINLRVEESDRTWLMLVFYTLTSVGLRWAEDSTVALFIDQYGSRWLPWIYIASAMLGMLLVFFYSQLQKLFSLRWVIALLAPCMLLPLILLCLSLEYSSLAIVTIFLLRLWVDGFYILNDLNTSIAANQLFNIREIKRAYPIISSGILVADILSGFSLPLLLVFVGLKNIILVSVIFILLGASVLWYISQKYRNSFPESSQKTQNVPSISTRHLSTPIKRYSRLLFGFFALSQIIWVLVDFQYLTQLEQHLSHTQLASFLGIFGGITGLCELLMQLFVSSRFLEKFGVFFAIASLPLSVAVCLPIAIVVIDTLPVTHGSGFFWGLVFIKFLDELLRYTLIIGSSPLLFQPIPERIRNYVQTLSGGIAESFGAGVAGFVILASLLLVAKLHFSLNIENWLLVGVSIAIALVCLALLWILRSHYVNLLVLSAGQGQLGDTDFDVRFLKQAAIKALKEDGNAADKYSCVQLLAKIDPVATGEILAPLVTKLPIEFQKFCLEAILVGEINTSYLPDIKSLLKTCNQQTSPEVFALALRYVWLAETNPDLSPLEKFLEPQQHSLIRATAASLLLRKGTPKQKVDATRCLQVMLRSIRERDRINAVQALNSSIYLQTLRSQVPDLLQDKSLRVRCAVLEMIAATRLEDHYPALFAGLNYRSTRQTALGCLVKLDIEVLPTLINVATNLYKPEVVRKYAWRAISQIPNPETIDILWESLETSKGVNRDYILHSLLKKQQREGISNFANKLSETKVEKLIGEELKFLGEVYSAYIDLKAEYSEVQSYELINSEQFSQKISSICQILQQSLLILEVNIKERLLLLLKLIYPLEKMQAASFNLRSQSPVNLARGLEILDHTVTFPSKPVLLNILDQREPHQKLRELTEAKILEYQPMDAANRVRKLLTFNTEISDWSLTCCFHFAQAAKIRLDTQEILATLRHPTAFVREAAICYLNSASQRILIELLPQLQNDPHPVIATQVRKLIKTQ
jgi:HEAT repeat protein